MKKIIIILLLSCFYLCLIASPGFTKDQTFPDAYLGKWIEKNKSGKEIGTLLITKDELKWDRSSEKSIVVKAQEVILKDDGSFSWFFVV